MTPMMPAGRRPSLTAKEIEALISENAKLRAEVERLRGVLADVGDLADRVIADKDFGLEKKADRLDAIGELVHFALAPEPAAPKHAPDCRLLLGLVVALSPEEKRCTCGATPPVEGGE